MEFLKQQQSLKTRRNKKAIKLKSDINELENRKSVGLINPSSDF